MIRLRKGVAFLILFSACLFTVAACTPETRYKVLSFFFDGVPKPGERRKPKKVKPPPAKTPTAGEIIEARAAPEEKTAPPPEPPRPPIEALRGWEEILRALPKDPLGGADWVRAMKEGVIAPRARVDSAALPEPPFTLDTIVQGIVAKDKPPFDLDIEILPAKAPTFKVVFPHSSHTLWLNCSGCHPGIVRQRGAGMAKILAGEYCGKCHGKVSFEPVTACARCHVDLVPSGEEAVEADLAKAQENPIPSSPEMLKRGKAVYLRACAVCHGEEGDGKGPLAAQLNPKPRDFTTGLFKFRTTPSSSLPTDFDIFRTITNGVLGTSMLAWSSLPYEDRWSLVHFIKTFSDEFTEEEPEEPIDISDPPARTPELVERGKKVYAEVECNSCHGDTGGGDGPSASDLKDEWGNPIRPFNFKSGLPPKGGSTPKDVYRALMTGLQGTPMPDFGEVFEEKEMAWAVVYYVLSLGEKKRGVGFGVKGDVRFHREPGGPGIPPATFPHWVHRIRFKCSACHPALFEMKAGANKVSMDAILKGKFCGACHNGKVAWISSFETCTRCHVAAQ